MTPKLLKFERKLPLFISGNDELDYVSNITSVAIDICLLFKLFKSAITVHQELRSATWRVIAEVVQLVQLSVTASALALYYIIYCYMQLVYYTLRSALYFHNADVPMKITIGVVTMTSLVVGFNLLLRMEKLFGVFNLNN